MIIRNMVIDDYDRVYALWLSCKGMGLNNIDDSKEGIERYLRRNPDTCFLAEENDEIIGVILSGNDGRRGFIHHTAVSPAHRRRGIAAELLDHAMNALKDCGITKVALVVFERNEEGNAFWEKQGFTAREDLVYRNKEIAELIRMDT